MGFDPLRGLILSLGAPDWEVGCHRDPHPGWGAVPKHRSKTFDLLAARLAQSPPSWPDVPEGSELVAEAALRRGDSTSQQAGRAARSGSVRLPVGNRLQPGSREPTAGRLWHTC
jgi:hypothetical protein